MVSEKEWEADGETYHWNYTCWVCVQAEKGFATEGEARDYIHENSGDIVSKRARVARFEEKRANVKATYAAMGVEAAGSCRTLAGEALSTLNPLNLSRGFFAWVALCRKRVRDWWGPRSATGASTN